MAKKKSSGVGALDRQIKATRAKISAIKKKKTAEKSAVRKKSTLGKLKNQLKRMGGSTTRKKR